MPGVSGRPATNGVMPSSWGVLPGMGVSVKRARLRCIDPRSSFTRLLVMMVVSLMEASVLA